MKNIFKKSLAALALVPTVFMFGACMFDGDDYNKKASVAKYDAVVQSYNNLGNNYTQTISFEFDDQMKQFVSYQYPNFDSEMEIVVKFDEEDMSTVVDGQLQSAIYNNREYSYEDEDLLLVNSCDLIGTPDNMIDDLLSLNFDNLKQIAFMLDDKAISSKNNTTSVKLNLGELVNELIEDFKENENRPIIHFINNVVDILYDDMTIDSFVAELKNEITSTTTIQNLLDFVEQKLGLDLEFMVEQHYRVGDVEEKFDAYTYNGYNVYSIDETYSTWDLIKEFELTELYGMSASKIRNEIDAFVENLSSNEMTLKDYIIRSNMKEYFGDMYYDLEELCDEDELEEIYAYFNDEYETNMSNIVNLKVNKLDVVINFVVGSANEFKGYEICLNSDLEYNYGGIKISTLASGKIKAEISNVGSTIVNEPNGDIANIQDVIRVKRSNLIEGEDFVIKKINRDYLDFEIEGVASLGNFDSKSSGKELVISSDIVDEILSDDENNVLYFDSWGNGRYWIIFE